MHKHLSVTRAAGNLPIIVLNDVGGMIGKPGGIGVIEHICMSVMRAAGRPTMIRNL